MRLPVFPKRYLLARKGWKVDEQRIPRTGWLLSSGPHRVLAGHFLLLEWLPSFSGEGCQSLPTSLPGLPRGVVPVKGRAKAPRLG